MTTKIYRLADERDVDSKKLVYVTDEPNFIFEFDGSFCAHSKRVIEKIEIDEKINSVIYHTKNPHEKYPEKWRYAFVEVTLADFNTQDIIHYLRDKGYTVWNESATKEERDLSYRTGYDAGKLSNKNYREVYGRGYGAGKRDAAPKWVSVKDESPPFDVGVIVCYEESFLGNFFMAMALGYLSPEDNIWYAEDRKLINNIPANIIHNPTRWMPLPAPPEDAQEDKFSITGTLSITNGGFGRTCECTVCTNIIPFSSRYAETTVLSEIKYICSKECYDKLFKKLYACKQCKKQITIDKDVAEFSGFCNEKCAADYEWVYAEFPRDDKKECRALTSDGWVFGELIGINEHDSGYPFIVKRKDTGMMNCFGKCQVRRDSV